MEPEARATFTLNFSGSSALILAQHYNFIRHDRAGYASLVRATDANAAPRLPLVVGWVREDAVHRRRPRRGAG